MILVFWLFFRRRVALVLLLLLFAGYQSIVSTVAVNIGGRDWDWQKDTADIRIMSWNVNYFGSPMRSNDSSGSQRQRMLEFVRKAGPDILCLQDMQVIENRGEGDPFVDNIADIMKAGNFTAVFFPFNYAYNGINYADKTGVMIFSRFPVIDTGSVETEGKTAGERSGFIGITANGKNLRIYNGHLSSMSLWPSVREKAGVRYFRGDSTRLRIRGIYERIKDYGASHAREADVIRDFIGKSPVPVIFAGDLNSVPSSYVYHRLKKGMKDAFLEKGFATGGTYNRVFPKLRIDAILHSPDFKTHKYYRPVVDMSDHLPVIADIR